MTRKPHIAWRIAVEQYGCERCGAAPGQQCLTDNHNPKGEPHAERSRKAAAHHWNTDLLADQESQDNGQG